MITSLEFSVCTAFMFMLLTRPMLFIYDLVITILFARFLFAL